MKHPKHSHPTTRTHMPHWAMNTSFVDNDRRNHSRIRSAHTAFLTCQHRTKDNRKKNQTKTRRRIEIENCGISVFQSIMISYSFDLLLGVIRVFVRNQIKIAFAQRATHKKDSLEKPNVEYSLGRGKITVPLPMSFCCRCCLCCCCRCCF